MRRPHAARLTQLTLFSLIVLSVGLVLIAGLRTGDAIPDLSGYEQWYLEGPQLKDYLSEPRLLFGKDPGYFLLTSVFAYYGLPFSAVVFAFALIAVTWKVKGIRTMSISPLYSVAIYLSYYFLVDEMIAIRAGVASAIFLLSIPYLTERRYGIYTFYVLLACCFHYSALVLFPVAWIVANIERPVHYLGILLASIAAGIIGFTFASVFSRLPIFSFDQRLAYYLTASESQLAIANIFNRISIPNLVLCLILLANFDELKSRSPYASTTIRIFVISQALFFGLSDIPVFGFRLSQLVGVTGLIAWPLLLLLLRPSWVRLPVFGVICANFLHATLRLFP